MATIAPKEITPIIRKLCQQINSGEKPVWVPVQVVAGAVPNECFGNAVMKIANSGGTIQYGWTIWEWKDVLVEGEFHAVWRSPEDKLLCVSPQVNGEKRVLFLPDNSRAWDEKNRIDNIRIPLRQDSVVMDFIAVKQELTKEMNALASSQFGVVAFAPSERFAELSIQERALFKKINELSPIPKGNNFCLCGSGKKYKKCCGSNS